MYAYTSQEIEMAKATARVSGAVGMKAIVPRLVKERVLQHTPKGTHSMRVLDFGCGGAAAHVKAFVEGGYSVDGYDFSGGHYMGDIDRWMPGPLDVRKGYYHLAYASNVLNVQSSGAMLRETLRQLRALGCPVVVNYPASPRKLGLTPHAMEALLWIAGFDVERLRGKDVGSNIVWLLK